MNLLPYCEGGSMIPVDLSANCEVWIYDPNGSGIPDPWDQIPGSVFGIHGHVWLLPVFTCIFFFALSATYFGISARHAFVRSRTPMILCLSNARSGDLHFDTSFVALHALVREIIPNTMHTQMT